MELKISKCFLAITLLSLNSPVSSFEISDLLNDENYDEDAYERMFPDDDILVSRRREDPETDEDFWESKSTNDDTSSSKVITSNIDDGKSMVLVNGINIDDLPANYHNTTTIRRKVGNKTVTVNVTIDKTTDPVTGATSISIIQTSNNGGIELTQCTESKSCGKGKYCRHLLYGNFCSNCSSINEQCESNAQCCGAVGALCVRGKCQTGYKQGQAGTLCKTKKDCNSSLCCARQFMKRNGECKSLAKKGQKCAAAHEEMNLILHPGLCPCENGLVCSSGSWMKSLFGGSMNTLLGGNTCRTPGSKHRITSEWPSLFFDKDDDEGDLDDDEGDLDDDEGDFDDDEGDFDDFFRP